MISKASYLKTLRYCNKICNIVLEKFHLNGFKVTGHLKWELQNGFFLFYYTTAQCVPKKMLVFEIQISHNALNSSDKYNCFE